MKTLKWLMAPVCLAAVLFFAGTASAQLTTPQVVGVGSSALFPSVTISMLSPAYGQTSAYCGSNIWTGGGFLYSGSTLLGPLAYGADNRSTSIPIEPGNISVVWNGSTDGTTSVTQVCVYLSVDSVVGQRLFLGTTSAGTNGQVFLNSLALSTAGAGKVAYVTDTVQPSTCASGQGQGTGTGPCGLPQPIYTIVNGANFNVAFTDIRPEDGLYATNRALCSVTSTPAQCLGYVPNLYTGIAYSPIQSSFNLTSVANVVPYSIPASGVPGSDPSGTVEHFGSVSYTIGSDPITGATIPAITTIPIGADPVLVIANLTQTGAGHLGNASFTNINSHALSQLYSGYTFYTGAVLGPGGSGNPMPVITREPTSGTYNTFEYQIVRSRDNLYGNSQELNNGTPSASSFNCYTVPNGSTTSPITYALPGTACQNPLWVAGYERARAIGTGEMVSAVSANADALGYAFWSLGSFGKKTNIKYVTVDGSDPLYASYSVENGLFPTSTQCTGTFNGGTFSCSGWTLPSFPNIKNGGYRIFSTLRAITAASTPTFVAGLIQAAQDQAFSTIPDFVPFQVHCPSAGSVNGVACTTGTVVSALPVFRSHYGQSGSYPNNGLGLVPGVPEGGGDVAGGSVLVQTEATWVAYAGPTGEGVYYNILQ